MDCTLDDEATRLMSDVNKEHEQHSLVPSLLSKTPALAEFPGRQILRIARPRITATVTDGLCMFHYGPALCGQIRESSSWSQGMNCDGFNVWRPSSLLFGICITTLGPNPIKLNSNDLVVTDALKDTDIQKTMGLDTIRFSHANIVGAVDIDRPPFYRCSVCFSSRGGVILASGERWKFTEIDSDYYHFFHEEEHPRQDASSLGANSLVWMFYSCSPDSIYMEGIPEDLPFRLDLDTRVCRVKGPSSCPNYGLTGGAVLAVMNRDGIVYCDGVDQNRDLNTVDLKNLVLMTALAVAHYEKWAIA